jgi:hypothetical protein
MKQAIIRSSNGNVYIDYFTGEVKRIDLEHGGSLPAITKFDLPIHDKAFEYDILDLGFWLDTGQYITASNCQICHEHMKNPAAIIGYANINVCLKCFHKNKVAIPIAPEGDNVKGPYYYKILKTTGQPRFVESCPKGQHIIEYIERIDYYGQDKMHYLSLMKPDGHGGYTRTYVCDFRSVCGFDRGPKFERILKRIWKHG